MSLWADTWCMRGFEAYIQEVLVVEDHFPGGGEDDGEEGDRGDVLDDPLGEGVGLVHGLEIEIMQVW